jgi:type I restriction enzyme S subunit
MSEARWDLPESWTWAAAGELARIVGGGTPSSKVESYFAENGVPWITPADLTGYRLSHISRGRRDLSKAGFASCGAQMIPTGSVLFSSRAPIGYCVMASNDLSTNQGFKSLVLHGDIVPEYIRYYLLSAKEYAESKASGTTFMELSGARVAELSIPLAPIPEQKRIVAKLDGLTARTARARADLDRIPTLIARYKQRLLALAFSGHFADLMTEEVRARMVEIGELTEISSGYGFPKERQGKTSGDYPFAKVSDISRSVAENGGKLGSAANYVDREDLRTLRAKPVEAGSIVFAKIGEALKLNRRAIALVPLILDNNCMALTPDRTKIIPEYLLYFMQMVDLGPLSVATAVPSVRRGDVANLRVYLPSLDEQAELVGRIESSFNWLDRMGADHAAATKLLPKLDAAILAKAFRGELVPQDPNDEPATALLARIKTEWAASSRRVRNAASVNPKTLGSKAVEPGELGWHSDDARLPSIRPNFGASAMTKSRQDDDVMGKPYLANLLKAGHGASAQDLFKAADLPVADFYKQLAWEIANKHIRDDDEKLEAL